MARNKKTKRINLPQETLERARAEMRGEVYIPDAEDYADEDEIEDVAPVRSTRSVPATATKTAVKTKTATATTNRPVAAPVATNRSKRNANTVRRVPSIGELLEEYSYVLHDLRNLGILAVSLLVTILVLALIITHV